MRIGLNFRDELGRGFELSQKFGECEPPTVDFKTEEPTLEPREPNQSAFHQFSQNIALTGLLLYVAFAPHSMAASSIGVALATLGWLFRIFSTRPLGLRRSKFDFVILLSLLWTVVSAFLSEEPRISLAKLQASWCVLLFYLTRAVVTKRSALLLVAVLILSGSVGVGYSAYDLLRGRGVVIESLSAISPFRQLDIRANDTVWRINGARVYSVKDIDDALRKAPAEESLTVSLISKGEHVQRPGLSVSTAAQQSQSPSGLTGSTPSHQFRASGWTRHYQTFAELLQMIAQLALGLALAHFTNHGVNKYFRLALAATVLVAVGIAFTAMRTVLVAFVI